LVKVLQNYIQHPALKVNPMCTGHYWDHQCGFRRNRSTIDHIFRYRQLFVEKLEKYQIMHQAFRDVNKAYNYGEGGKEVL
jgi:hypothetical protein